MNACLNAVKDLGENAAAILSDQPSFFLAVVVRLIAAVMSGLRSVFSSSHLPCGFVCAELDLMEYLTSSFPNAVPLSAASLPIPILLRLGTLLYI